jgi:hypothetical protein
VGGGAHLRVVRAMLRRSSRNASGSALLSSTPSFSSACADTERPHNERGDGARASGRPMGGVRTAAATSQAWRKPAMMVCGWIFCEIRSSATLSSSPASTHTDVVPSPTSSSWTFEISTSTLAAGLSIMIDLRMVAPSLVIWTCPPPIGCRILSIPFGPSVVLTRSQIANAPMKDAMRLFSPVSRCAPSSSTVGIESPNILRHAQGGY